MAIKFVQYAYCNLCPIVLYYNCSKGRKGELKMKKSFVFVHSDGTEEVVEYDSSMYTEDDVRTIYSNMDKFYSSLL